MTRKQTIDVTSRCGVSEINPAGSRAKMQVEQNDETAASRDDDGQSWTEVTDAMCCYETLHAKMMTMIQHEHIWSSKSSSIFVSARSSGGSSGLLSIHYALSSFTYCAIGVVMLLLCFPIVASSFTIGVDQPRSTGVFLPEKLFKSLSPQHKLHLAAVLHNCGFISEIPGTAIRVQSGNEVNVDGFYDLLVTRTQGSHSVDRAYEDFEKYGVLSVFLFICE